MRSSVIVAIGVAVAGLAAGQASAQTHTGAYALHIVKGVEARLLAEGYRTSYAIGDFNDDGYPDLAVGIPYATVDGKRAAGKVIVHDGAPDGFLQFTHTYSQAEYGPYDVPGRNEKGDLVGFSLAACDFDGDGDDDLAVGAPGEDRGIRTDAGAVFVGYGTSLVHRQSDRRQQRRAWLPRNHRPLRLRGISQRRPGLRAG